MLKCFDLFGSKEDEEIPSVDKPSKGCRKETSQCRAKLLASVALALKCIYLPPGIYSRISNQLLACICCSRCRQLYDGRWSSTFLQARLRVGCTVWRVTDCRPWLKQPAVCHQSKTYQTWYLLRHWISMLCRLGNGKTESPQKQSALKAMSVGRWEKIKSLRSTFETTSSTFARCALQNLQLYTLPSRWDVKIRPIFPRCKPARHAVVWHLLSKGSHGMTICLIRRYLYVRAHVLQASNNCFEVSK